jgi:hypothetical protein
VRVFGYPLGKASKLEEVVSAVTRESDEEDKRNLPDQQAKN